MNRTNLIRWIVGGLILFVAFSYVQNATQEQPVIMSFSELESVIEQKPTSIKQITIVNGSNEIKVEREGLPTAKVVVPSQAGQAALIAAAAKQHVPLVAKENEQTMLGILLSILFHPFVLMIALFWFVMRSQSGMFGGMTNSGAQDEQKNVTTRFTDVAGCNEAKEELEEVVAYLRNPKGFTLGARPPRGVLLVGPPGNGKTLLARAVAGEAGVTFFNVAASEFVKIFAGAGAAKVRDLFTKARKSAPCIIFIDEIDAIGRQRSGGGFGGGHDEREQTLNQILVEMDGFKQSEGIVVIAATNRADVLDSAFTRSGRFDLQVSVDAPDTLGREEIFKVHMRGFKVAEDVRASQLARITPGFSGADIANACNQAALVAERRLRKTKVKRVLSIKKTGEEAQIIESQITVADFSEGIDRVLGGPARERFLSEEDLDNVAVHEIGHAGVGHDLKGDTIRKVTVVGRSRTLGYSLAMPEREKPNKTKDELLNQMASMMGGRIAQEEILGISDTGAANDFEQATKLARAMVTVYGMSPLGRIFMSEQSTNPFGGRFGSQGGSTWGPAIMDRVDIEVQKLLEEAGARARAVIQKRKASFPALRKKLVADQTVFGDEFVALWTAPPEAEKQEKDADGNPPSSNPVNNLLPSNPEVGDDQPLPSDRVADLPVEPQEEGDDKQS